MSISVEKQPAFVDLSGSYMPLWLSSDNVETAPGTAAVLQIEFAAIPNDGDDLNLSWDGGLKSVKLDFVAVPDDSGEEIGVFGSSISDWLVNTCIPALRQNYDLDKFYSFSDSGNTLVITAKDVGEFYTLTVDLNNTDSTVTNAAGSDQLVKSDFRILCIIEYATMDDPVEISNHEKVLNVIDSTAYFELNDPLYFLHKNLLPDIGAADVKNVSSNVLRWRARLCEMYGNDSTTSRIQDQAWKYALPGGRKRNSFIDHPSFYTQWFQTETDEVTGDYLSRFLTEHSSRKVGLHEPVYLNFLLTINKLSFLVKCTLNYSDGTSSTSTIYTVNPAVQFNLYNIPVGYQQIKSHIVSGKTLTSYSVFIQDGAGLLSDVSNFTVDRSNYHAENIVLFKNSLGVYETFRLTGFITDKTDFAREQAARVIKYPTSKTDRSSQTISTGYTNSYEIETGWLTSSRSDELREVLNSPDLYFLEENEWVPVISQVNEIERNTTNRGSFNRAKVRLTADLDKFTF